ncbi:hypothetical protein M501DRAFT_926553 [Patellaria atrata CBS 101060]|uniref:Uncharacterized protein n=1 Tax=Patellaria atrata CBS 101060 TaxID=1346257 RepID=A0A9P4VVF1_9PEZI|nr:hypothetical protein M501DRAFT_926553 [Patellaria atrata CBS 101060]
MPSSTNSIPLHCNICPKKPRFSDVSHLLTHIASKGHLSHYYKVKVRSSSEDSSKRLIESYDQWYADWNVEELMSERMNIKDKKRTRTTKSSGMASQTPTTVPSRPTYGRKKSNALDPRLSEHPIKHESRSTTPLSLDPAILHRTFVPPMQLFSARSTPFTTDSRSLDNSSEVAGHVSHRHPIDVDLYSSHDAEDTGEVEVEEIGSECTRLKGVLWPGMDIFDSATPEMRRKRNQKKDVSVIEGLEHNSTEVEAIESIWTPHGSLKKERVIDGLPDDSSPMKPSPSPPPRKRQANRAPLNNLDVNKSRRNTRNNIRQGFGARAQAVMDDEEMEIDLNYGRPEKKRKRAFDVFHGEEVSFSNPAGFSYLNSEFRPEATPERTHETMKYDPFSNGMVFEEKENLTYPAYQLHHTYGAPAMGFPVYQHAAAFDMNHYFANPLYFASYQMPQQEEVDDDRTVTASPSNV